MKISRKPLSVYRNDLNCLLLERQVCLQSASITSPRNCLDILRVRDYLYVSDGDSSACVSCRFAVSNLPVDATGTREVETAAQGVPRHPYRLDNALNGFPVSSAPLRLSRPKVLALEDLTARPGERDGRTCSAPCIHYPHILHLSLSHVVILLRFYRLSALFCPLGPSRARSLAKRRKFSRFTNETSILVAVRLDKECQTLQGPGFIHLQIIELCMVQEAQPAALKTGFRRYTSTPREVYARPVVTRHLSYRP